MKKYCYLFKLPLITISKKPLHFIQWLILVVVIGLLPFWFALLKNLDDENSFSSLSIYLFHKGLAMYSIAILSNGLAAAFLASKSGMSDNSIGVRAISNTICIFLLLLNTGVLFLKPSQYLFSGVNITQLIFCILAILSASYVYCFRESDWEKSADTFRDEDDAATQDLDEEASMVTKDKDGVIL